MKSDVFRYLYVYKMGGYYADADEFCNVTIAELEDKDADFLVGKRKNDNWVNGFFGAIAGSEVIGRVIDKVIDNIERRIPGGVWLVTGPGAFSPIVQRAIDNNQCRFRQLTYEEYAGDALHDIAMQVRKAGEHWSLAQKTKSIFTNGF